MMKGSPSKINPPNSHPSNMICAAATGKAQKIESPAQTNLGKADPSVSLQQNVCDKKESQGSQC